MRRLLPAVFALCLCLCVVSQGWSAGDGASKVAGAIGSVSPAPAGGSAAAAAATSAVPASDAPAEAASSSGAEAPARPIPDTPPPGWTEDQLANLRWLELQLRHGDTDPILKSGEPEIFYDITLTTQDVRPLGKTRPLCVKRVTLNTDLETMTIRCGTGQCLGYESFDVRTKKLSIPKKLHIRSAFMDVAPDRDAPESALLRNLDAIPMLRAVPLPPVSLTLSGRPLPKIPAKIPAPTKKNPWPSRLRIHLANAFTDTKAPYRRCYTYLIIQVPREAETFSGIQARTNIGDYTDIGSGVGFPMLVCAPGGTNHINIRRFTVWKRWKYDKPIDAGALLAEDDFTPLLFVTNNGSLPPPADGMYPPRPRLISLGDPE